jgi:UDP-N-acetylglucosamine--N-acetylmuramyl-(pentapeptide) pyrophosphoryl-undecaprenol N-acetylglucosamine transferase
MTRTILIMAAGSGGHIFPGIAIANELKARGWSIHWMGTPAGWRTSS